MFITNIPSFYKVRLWNELNKRVSVYAVFVYASGGDRNEDFFSEVPEFQYMILPPSGLLKKCLRLAGFLHSIKYDKLVIGGWETFPSILAYFLSPKKKNAVICESNIFELQRSPLKDVMKRMVLSRCSAAFPCGVSQAGILELFGYKGRFFYTGGCGILNYVPQPEYEERKRVHRFLFVGRLVEEKNLKMLIDVFNGFRDLSLDIVGFGKLESELKSIAGDNISFLGAVDNKRLPAVYQSHDVFILPSRNEAWGLVVEEALNNGCPVIVSDMVGCREELVNSSTGLVFPCHDKEALANAIIKMTDLRFYNHLRKCVSKLDFPGRSEIQIGAYIKMHEE